MIARVFPTRTNMCPTDSDVYFGEPYFPSFMPKYDEVHISCQFTWDIVKAKHLQQAWEVYFKTVKLGGVAIDGESEEPFIAGIYLRKGITITSRGCPNACPFCMVEHRLIEFNNFPEGNIIQDNNILACSDKHWQLVMSMLKKQRAIEFKGGLQAARITPKIVEDLRSLRIKTLWLACDSSQAVHPLRKAVKILQKAGFTRSHLYCYCLIGKDMREEEHRLIKIWEIGCMPFAQLYRNREDDIRYQWQWGRFARAWSLPAIIRSRAKHKWIKWQ